MSLAFFDELGGMPCLEEVHRIFYGKLLRHPWLKEFFEGVPRSHLESQQSEFMCGVFGGPKIYGGRPPKTAHTHLYITEEVFLTRHDLLRESLIEAGISPDLRERWLVYDMRMLKVLVKKSLSECEGRYKNEPVISVPKPREFECKNEMSVG